MARFTITPWRTQSDLLHVRQNLYHLNESEQDLRRNAVSRVMAWKLRGHLPHAVESTALLVDAILHHTTSSTANSSFSIRAVYSAAFCRFVTGFCDIGRSKEGGLVPSSMLEIARQIDMPSEFVALRHEAIHEELPSLGRLVEATERGLEWLWRAYWERLDGAVVEAVNVVDLSVVKEQARALFRGFRSMRREAFRANRQNSPEHRLACGETAQECIRLCQGSVSSTGAVVEVLVEDRLLMPSGRELHGSFDGALSVWGKLLDDVSQAHSPFRPALVDALLASLEADPGANDENSIYCEGLCYWTVRMASKLSPNVVEKPKRDLRSDAVKWVCLHTSYWASSIGRTLLETGDEDLREQWGDLFRAAVDVDTHITDRVVSTAGEDQEMLETELEHAPPDVVASLQGQSNGNLDGLETGVGWRRLAVAPHRPIGVVC